ncbi:MAG TPA: F0F1 ATP synthase subunit A [Allosphingosinicella sp.]|nr:F0F1 ATP synthase subunit A [Allosphingosinicella sp.]
MAAESKIDPMHQFQISPLAGNLDGSPFVFTNSALWMLVVLALIWLFMLGGMRRAVVPTRWQVMVEGVTGFINSMLTTNVGPEGRKYVPWVFTIFMFILFANLLGMMPLALVGAQPFTVTSQFTVTGIMAIISFGIVLVTGFWRHKLHFFSLFVPHGTPFILKLLIVPIEFVSFMVRPFSLALRLFVAMIAGHILVEVFGSFVVSGINAGGVAGPAISLLSFVFMVGVMALEVLVCAIQAYVFALLTSLYINDAVNLH